MAHRRAVIDLGTNTFHLLIAEVRDDGTIQEIYRERRFVKLAEAGIERIGPAPFQRGIDTLRHFRTVLDAHEISQASAFGTAALRTADNGEVFVRTAELESGIIIQLISGATEAELITRGVLAALPPLEERVLIMDIGGGSTEFIIAGKEGVYWRASFPVGISVLHTQFHRSDPISEADVRDIERFLSRHLQPLREKLEEYPTHHLVGAAGTFDVLGDILKDPTAPAHPTSHRLRLDGLRELFFELIASSRAERIARGDIPEPRLDMFVPAMLELKFVIELAGIERITVSDWAMKEGVMISE